MIRTALSLALLSAVPLSHAAPDLTTVAERSGFQNTGRYDEVVKLCADFQKAYPKSVRCFEFGRTPEGRPMLALAVSKTGALTAQAAKKKNVPVLLVQGGIHAGETFHALFPDGWREITIEMSWEPEGPGCWYISTPGFTHICPIGLFVKE